MAKKPGIFPTFFISGFECSTFLWKDQKRRNLIEETQHDRFAFKDYELQKQTLALEEENIVLAKENVFIASERLRLGITTFVELREAQQSLEEAYNRLIAARYDTKVAETELLRLKGDLVR